MILRSGKNTTSTSTSTSTSTENCDKKDFIPGNHPVYSRLSIKLLEGTLHPQKFIVDDDDRQHLNLMSELDYEIEIYNRINICAKRL